MREPLSSSKHSRVKFNNKPQERNPNKSTRDPPCLLQKLDGSAFLRCNLLLCAERVILRAKLIPSLCKCMLVSCLAPGCEGNRVRGVKLDAAVFSIPSANTIARPASKCQSIWQWRNHGPGLSVYTRKPVSILEHIHPQE